MTTVHADVENVVGYIRSAAPYIWVQTSEYDYVTKDIIHGLKAWLDAIPGDMRPKLCSYRWDTASGMSTIGAETMELAHSGSGGTGADVMENYPLTEIANIANECVKKRRDGQEDNARHIVFIFDYHKFIDQVNIWRQMQNNYSLMEENGITAVIVSPVISIPSEIQDYIIAIDYPYPDAEFIKNAVVSEAEVHPILAGGQDSYIPAPVHDIDKITNAALGLSRTELFQGINFSLADSSDSGIHASYITSIKEARLAKDNAIKILPSTEGFDSLVGMERLKDFTKKMILSGKGRGALLLGVPGSGKSAFAATLGKETGRTTLSLDFATLMGGVVGETEQKTAHAIKVIDSMQPCILFVDEIEKGLAGVSGYNGDSGTSRRQGSLFLKWLSDHKTEVFVIATANSINDLPPEFKRAERWDAIFFLDVPGQAQAKAILQYYATKYELTEPLESIDVEGYTGAEIKSICRLANAQDISITEAKEFVMPITQSFDIASLRSMASQCAISAEAPIALSTPTMQPAGRRSAIIPRNHQEGGTQDESQNNHE